jgi:hypothetical protein
MPLPNPSGKEDRSKFISRCVSELSHKGEGEDAAQRVAICNSKYKQSKAMQIELIAKELEALKIFLKKG